MTLTQSTQVIADQIIKHSSHRPRRKATAKSTAIHQPPQKPKGLPLQLPSPTNQWFQHKCPRTLSSSKAPSKRKHHQMLKQKHIESKSIISTIQKTGAQNPEVSSWVPQVGTCSPNQPYATKYYVSPNYKGPETCMKVGETECVTDS